MAARPPSPLSSPGSAASFAPSEFCCAAAWLPAIVVMMPLVSTLRTRLLPPSVMYMVPSLATQTPSAWFSWALTARRPSPPKVFAWLFPATVWIVGAALLTSTLRMVLLP